MALLEFKNLPDTSAPITAENLNNNFTECNNIVESNSNENGSYIKYSDGTMICYGVRTNTLTNNSAQIGSMWYTNAINLGRFPVAFIETPSVFLHNVGALTILEHISISKTNIGSVYMGNGTQRTNVVQNTMFLAVGKWK